MYLILNYQNLIAEICRHPCYVRRQANGAVVLSEKERADAIYSNDTDAFYPVESRGRLDEGYRIEQVESVPPEVEAGYYFYRAGEFCTTGERQTQLKRAREREAAVALAKMLLPQTALTADQTITLSVLYELWTEGRYKAGDIRVAEAGGTAQPWKCRQEHDTAAYPDISPRGEAWRTFWVPFHGTAPETAQSWVAPTMAEDMYLSGEYMVWTDGGIYRCTQDTSFSPQDYPQAWEKME